jgi:iron complex outermembrane receptor protein
LTTNLNAYYYKLNGFSYDIDGQTVTGEGNHNFTWNARMIASVILPYDISVQFSGRYRARQVITQGYRKAGSHFDLGVRKNFFNKKLTLSINCRDLFNSRKWDNFTSSDTFWRHQLNKRGSRKVSFTVTWNFGNTNKKKRPERPNDQEDNEPNDQYGGGEAGNQ